MRTDEYLSSWRYIFIADALLDRKNNTPGSLTSTIEWTTGVRVTIYVWIMYKFYNDSEVLREDQKERCVCVFPPLMFPTGISSIIFVAGRVRRFPLSWADTMEHSVLHTIVVV